MMQTGGENIGSIRKGMILSAGLGTRLSPITRAIPKPLVPVLNLPNVVHAIDLLKRTGIREIVINLHHLAATIRSHLGDGMQLGVSIRYTVEENLLGTGGGIKNAAAFFANEPFVVVNCDFVTNLDLKEAIGRHTHRQALATMILTEPRGKEYTPVYSDQSGRLTGIDKPGNSNDIVGTFTGIHILSAAALSYLKPIPSGIINDLYPPAIGQGLAFGEIIAGSSWHDTGDIPALYSSTMALLHELSQPAGARSRHAIENYLDYREKKPGIWIPAGKALPTIKLEGPCILASPELIPAGSQVGPNVVLSAETALAVPCNISDLVTIGSNVIGKATQGALLFENNPLKINGKVKGLDNRE